MMIKGFPPPPSSPPKFCDIKNLKIEKRVEFTQEKKSKNFHFSFNSFNIENLEKNSEKKIEFTLEN